MRNERRRGMGLMLGFMLLLFGSSAFLFESLGVYGQRAGANVPPTAFAARFDSGLGSDFVPGLSGNGKTGFAKAPGHSNAGGGDTGAAPGTGPGSEFTGATYDPFAETSKSFGQDVAGLNQPGGGTGFPLGELAAVGGSPGQGGSIGPSDIIGGGIGGGGGGIGQTPDPTSPLPEPEEWMLLITGFAVALFALWRRRTGVQFAY